MGGGHRECESDSSDPLSHNWVRYGQNGVPGRISKED